jgi:hypothetical protein
MLLDDTTPKGQKQTSFKKKMQIELFSIRGKIIPITTERKTQITIRGTHPELH